MTRSFPSQVPPLVVFPSVKTVRPGGPVSPVDLIQNQNLDLTSGEEESAEHLAKAASKEILAWYTPSDFHAPNYNHFRNILF